MIHMKDEVIILAGTGQPEAKPWEPFAEPVLKFLGQLSCGDGGFWILVPQIPYGGVQETV